MKKINADNFIDELKTTFPDFLPYWNAHVDYWGQGLGLSNDIMPFSDYVLDIIKSNNADQLKVVFDYIEFLMVHGDQAIQDATATSLLEYLLSKDPEEIQFSKFAHLLGPETLR